jgi:hypothetical protein
MNLPNHQILTTNPGVLAVLSAPVTTAGDDIPDMTTAGAERWHPIMRGAALMLRHTTETELRVVVGDHIVIVQVEGEQIVAVVVASAHAVNKSIHRMIRRSVRAPKTKPAPGAPAEARPGGGTYIAELSAAERQAVQASQGAGFAPGSPRNSIPRGDQW